MAHIGVDVSKKKLDVCWLREPDAGKVKARVLADYGAQKRPQPRQPEPAEVRELHHLLARLDTVSADIQREYSRREKAAFTHEACVLDSIDQVLHALRDEERRLREQIDDHIQRHLPFKEDQRLLETIPGMGDETSRQLLVAMRGRGFTSARHAAAFFGLVPLDWESGSSVKAQPRLSKAGQAHLRQKL